MNKHTGALAVACAAGALLLTACADTLTSPFASSLVRQPNAPSLTISHVVPSATLKEGEVQLCKSVSLGDPAETFSFAVDVTPSVGSLSSSTVNLDVPAGGTTCQVVYTSGVPGNEQDQVVITENGPPANWSLATINTVQIAFTTYYTNNPGMFSGDVEDVGNQKVTVYVNQDMGRQVTFTNDYTPPAGNEGCTPGYWKQDQHFDSWPAAYAPGDSYNGAFGIGTNWFPNSFSLLDALTDKGGGIHALARHSAAALLNAASGFYPLTTADVIADLQAAYNGSADIEVTKDLFAGYNELGCPLN